jgi:hypothetical protein
MAMGMIMGVDMTVAVQGLGQWVVQSCETKASLHDLHDLLQNSPMIASGSY